MVISTINWFSGGRYSIMRTGELHIRHVTKRDEFQSYQCATQHNLSKENSVSAVAGRYVSAQFASSSQKSLFTYPKLKNIRTGLRFKRN